jgi:hypothetical protein
VHEAEKEADLLKARIRGKGAEAFKALVQKIESTVRGAH